VTGGNFFAGAGWSSAAGTIDLTGGSLSLGGTFTLASLGALNHNGGLLDVRGTLDNHDTIVSVGATHPWQVGSLGRIAGGTITSVDGTPLLAAGRGTLESVSLQADVRVTDGTLSVTGLTQFNGRTFTVATASSTSGSQLLLPWQGSIDDATVVLAGPGVFMDLAGVADAGSLTLGPNMIVRTDPLSIGGRITNFGGELMNLGRIAATSGGRLNLTVATFDNAGTVSADTGSAVRFSAIVSNTGTIDIGGAGSGAVFSATPRAQVEAQVRNARHNGAWDQPGITSSAAAANTNHSTTLGVLSGAAYLSLGHGTFAGFNVAPTDVLVKYTWYGDSDFNGRVDFDDYIRIDNGFNNHLTGWFNGDFDLDGQVNFDDYVLIDLAFNTQDGTLRRAIGYLDGSDREWDAIAAPALRKMRQHLDQFGDDYARRFLAAVPEPTALPLGAIALSSLLARRRRRCR
jgi:hypothetical protein